jgi:hypothetical protein
MASIIVRTGGQTGVDRAALDHAIATRLPYCGWCPDGGWAEDYPQGPGLLNHYPHLIETPSSTPKQRTAWNVRDSHATLILLGGIALTESPGTQFTHEMASLVFMKPYFKFDIASLWQTRSVQDWLDCLITVLGTNSLILNIAGPRESESPGIYAEARTILLALLPNT